jgi:hypothetical protein
VFRSPAGSLTKNAAETAAFSIHAQKKPVTARPRPVSPKRKGRTESGAAAPLFDGCLPVGVLTLLVGNAAAGLAGGLAAGLALAAAAVFGALAEIPGFQSLDSLHLHVISILFASVPAGRNRKRNDFIKKIPQSRVNVKKHGFAA